MKLINHSVIFGTALLMLAGCSADDWQHDDGLVPLSLTPEIETEAEAETRAGTSLLNSFSTGDVLGILLTNSVNSSGTALTSTTYTVGTGFATQPYISPGKTATVKGYYPSSASSATSFTVKSSQTTDANYKSSDLMYAAAQNATKASPSPTLTFTHKMAKLIVNVTAGDGISSITSVTLNNISRTVAWTASTGTLGALSSSGNITMSNNGAALIPPQTTSESNNFLTVVTSGGTAYYKVGKTFGSGKVYTLNITVNAAAIGTTTTITGWTDTESATVQPTVEMDNAPAGVQAVDLGIYVGGGSSGKKLLWANMNVGATSVTGYGTYFAWGETSGWTQGGTNTKTYYDWDTYAWCQGKSTTLTKYCPTSQRSSYWWDKTDDANKAPDNKTELDIGDDAARANWGGKWRMPTKVEFEALLALTKGWVANYNSSGVAGYTFTGNGNTIFLPAAGYRFSWGWYSEGSYGYYLSSSLVESTPKYAWKLRFYSGNADMYDYIGRSAGCSVRPVREE